MKRQFSRVLVIGFFSALLLGGFPNFMINEAYASSIAYNVTVDTGTRTTTTTQITVVFDNQAYASAGSGSLASCFEVNGSTSGVSTATSLDTTQDGSGTTTFTLTIPEINTGDTPTLRYTGVAGSCVTQITHDDVGGGNLATTQITVNDDVAPTLVSAQVTSPTTVAVNFSESINSGSVATSDFTVTNPTRTVSEVSVSGSTVTLTVSPSLSSVDKPTITIVSAIDDNNSGTSEISSGSVSATNSISTGGGGGCDGDCQEPTLGILPNGQRVVDDGFIYNGHAVDVERFFTPYPQITANVGKTNIANFKIYEDRGPDNIKHFSFAFGLDKGDIIADSKARIELDRAFDGTETVTVFDPENALDNIKVTTNIVSCNDDSSMLCLGVEIQHTFRAPLEFNIVATDVWDNSRQSWQNYYNHGIEVVGASMNPAKQHDGINQGEIYHLTETGKNTAIDEFGESWTFQYGQWSKDFIKQERIQDEKTLVFDRMHSDFAKYRESISNEAFTQLAENCPLCIEQYADFDHATSWEYEDKINKLSDPQIQSIMSLEHQKAQEVLKYIMDPKLSSIEKYNASLEKDERSISEILEEERQMKSILQAERAWLKQVIAPNQ